MALDLTYAASAGYVESACVERVLELLTRVGFRLWDDALLERDSSGELAVLTGLQEFREHLGGKLHVTMISDIGRGFEVTEVDERLVVEAVHALQRRDAVADLSASGRSGTTASDPEVIE